MTSTPPPRSIWARSCAWARCAILLKRVAHYQSSDALNAFGAGVRATDDLSIVETGQPLRAAGDAVHAFQVDVRVNQPSALTVQLMARAAGSQHDDVQNFILGNLCIGTCR